MSLDLSRVDYLALEGGGVKGFAYVGALEVLERHRPLCELRVVAGTSAGAVTALLLALRADVRRLGEILAATPWHRFGSPAWQLSYRWLRLAVTGGLHSSAFPERWLRRTVRGFGLHDSVSFRDLSRTTGVDLRVAVTNEDLARAEIHSPQTTPSLSVVRSVLASMAIPVWWPPVEINGARYSDGGTTWNHPVDALPNVPERILGLRVDSPEEIEGTLAPRRARGALARIARLFALARRKANEAHIPERLWERVVRIPVDVPATRFHLGDREREELIRRGREALEAVARGS